MAARRATALAAALFVFDESINTLRSRCASMGMDIVRDDIDLAFITHGPQGSVVVSGGEARELPTMPMHAFTLERVRHVGARVRDAAHAGGQGVVAVVTV